VEKRMHAYVSGIVQGVFFRSFVQEIAIELGLTGFVRNLRDGRVEVVAEGPVEKLETLEKELWRGPPFAVVDNVEVSYHPPTGEFRGFVIRR
jgi:acylphosphatase